jgi:hypothetical protein
LFLPGVFAEFTFDTFLGHGAVAIGDFLLVHCFLRNECEKRYRNIVSYK